MSKDKDLYYKIADVLIANGIITLSERDLISRVGNRKESYWKRHLLDLCEYSLEHKSIEDVRIVTLLQNTVKWCKS